MNIQETQIFINKCFQGVLSYAVWQSTFCWVLKTYILLNVCSFLSLYHFLVNGTISCNSVYFALLHSWLCLFKYYNFWVLLRFLFLVPFLKLSQNRLLGLTSSLSSIQVINVFCCLMSIVLKTIKLNVFICFNVCLCLLQGKV